MVLLSAGCPRSDGDYFVPVEVPVAFPSGLEAEEAQPLQYHLTKDADLALFSIIIYHALPDVQVDNPFSRTLPPRWDLRNLRIPPFGSR